MPHHASLLIVVAAAVSTAASALTAPQRSAKSERLAPDVQAACDAMYAVATTTPGASVRRRIGTFRDETLSKPVSGCGLDVSGSFARSEKTGDVATRLHDVFSDRGWQEMGAYSADGTDGTSFAFRKQGVSCLVRGTWDGGAEPDLPAKDWYKVTAFCTAPVFPVDRWR